MAAAGRVATIGGHIAPEQAAQRPDLSVLVFPASELTKRGFPQSAVRPFDTVPGPWKQQVTNPLGNSEEVYEWARAADTMTLWLKWQKEHGDIVRYRFKNPTPFKGVEPHPVREYLQLTDPQLANAFLTLNDVQKTPSYKDFMILGDGVLSSTDYDEWKLQRDLLKPAFTIESLKSKLPMMSNSVGKSVQLLHNLAKQQDNTIDILEELPRLTFEIIAKTALGEDPLYVNKINEELRTAMDVVSVKPFKGLTIHTDADYKEAYDYLHKFATEVLERADDREKERSIAAAAAGCPFHQNKLAGGVARQNASAAVAPAGHPTKDTAHSVLDLVRARDSNDRPILSKNLQEDELFTLMFAGHETTANTLGWLVAEVSRKPALQVELRDSILNSPVYQKAKEAALAAGQPASDAFKFLSLAELQRFDLVTKTLNETLRRWPVVQQGTFRMLDEDFVIGSYLIPAGTIVRTAHSGIHMHEKIWDKPFEFNPHRKWHNEAFQPFSRGSRDCLGRNLALMEMRMVVIAYFSNFSFTNMHTEDPRIFERLTIRPRGALRVQVSAL